MPLALCAAAAGLLDPAAAQDLRAQCTPQNATEALRAIYPSEIAQYPALAAILSDPAGGPVRAAINDCLNGREGGGRAGMQRWIAIPQNRQWYWTNIVGPPLAQELRTQCTAPNASQVLRTVFAAEVRNQPDLDRFFGMADATPVRAAVNDCQNGREGGGRAGMERWIAQPQNRQWYWQNLIASPFAQWQATQPRTGAPAPGGSAGTVVAGAGAGAGQAPATPAAPPGGSPVQPAVPTTPGTDVKVPYPSVPQRMASTASEARPFGQAGRDLVRTAALREIPEAAEAAAFLSMLGPLADLLANPNRLASLQAPGSKAGDPLELQRRVDLAGALAAPLLAHLERHHLSRIDDALHGLAWRADPAAVQPLASWRTRSLARISEQRVDLPEVRDIGVRLEWSRFDKAQTLFLMIELSRALKIGQQRIKQAGDYAEMIQDALDKFQGLDDLPIPQLQAVLKTVAVTVVVAEVSNLVIEGSTAMLPGRINDFYVRIEGRDRRQGDPPLTIEKDDRQKKLEVFMAYSSNGGTLSTPWNALEMLVPRMMKHPKVARAVEAAKKRAGAAAANLERQIEARIKADGYAALRTELERMYKANEDAMKEYGGKFLEYVKSSAPEWQIRASKRTTDLNSDRVLFMESNSQNLLKVDQTSEREFFLLALADSGGKEAGYHVALKQPLLERLVRLDDRSSASPNLRGTVIIVDPKKPPPPPRNPAAGTPCANGAGLIDIWGRCNLPN